MTHFILRSFNDIHAPRSQALFAVRPTDLAIVFVHGYRGDPIATWTEFHRLLPQQPDYTNSDLYFWGYDAIRGNIPAASNLFYEFMTRLFIRPAKLINRALPAVAARHPSFHYNKFLIVAHSLGAVVARWALVSDPNKGWGKNTSLAFFAPAHSGARVKRLAAAVSGFPFLKTMINLFRLRSPLLDELTPGSNVLKKLRKDTKAALRRGGANHVIPRKVILAAVEQIVYNSPFPGDPRSPPRSVTLPGTTHFSVCKPHRLFRMPVTELGNIL